MRILIAGASGFIGSALCRALSAAGHHVVRGVRRPQAPDEVAIDFSRPDPVAWQLALRGCDAAINAVGILRERGEQSFFALHTRGPQDFFSACVAAGVRRVVQVSAQGADRGEAPFLASKRAADDFLRDLPLAPGNRHSFTRMARRSPIDADQLQWSHSTNRCPGNFPASSDLIRVSSVSSAFNRVFQVEWQIVRPALVYGQAGASARAFRLLASLPLTPLPLGGKQLLHSIHIDDLCTEILRLLDPATPAGQCLDLRGGEALTLRELVASYRRSLGFPPAPVLALPGWLMNLAARIGEHLPGGLLDTQTWRMLQSADAYVGTPYPPDARRPAQFIPPREAPGLRQQALASWRAPLLRLALAAVWLITAWVSLFAWPIADSLALLARTGLTGTPALVALVGAALLDAAFGLATLFAPGRRLWLAQMALIVGYSAVIAVCLPEFLIHPYGPLSKNLTIVAVLILLYAEEERP